MMKVIMQAIKLGVPDGGLEEKNFMIPHSPIQLSSFLPK